MWFLNCKLMTHIQICLPRLPTLVSWLAQGALAGLSIWHMSGKC